MGGKTITSPTTSTSILNQQQALQTATSSVVTGEREKTVFDTFREIKLKNEILKNTTYTQFQKQASSSQSRLLSAFDSKKGGMHMAFLEVQISKPKMAADYKQSSFEFNNKYIHHIRPNGNEQIDRLNDLFHLNKHNYEFV